MIQRIQSLYLFLSIVAYILLFFFPFAKYASGEQVCSFSLLLISCAKPNSTLPLIIVVCLMAVACLAVIFLYKKRVIQIKMIAFILLFHIGFIAAAIFYYADKLSKDFGEPAYSTGAYLALIPLVFLVLANRAIRKDEKMVRASDRLR